MVTALVVEAATTAALGLPAGAASQDPIRTAALAGGSTALTCRIPGATG
jgi:hypothetical protein